MSLGLESSSSSCTLDKSQAEVALGALIIDLQVGETDTLSPYWEKKGM